MYDNLGGGKAHHEVARQWLGGYLAENFVQRDQAGAVVSSTLYCTMAGPSTRPPHSHSHS